MADSLSFKRTFYSHSSRICDILFLHFSRTKIRDFVIFRYFSFDCVHFSLFINRSLISSNLSEKILVLNSDFVNVLIVLKFFFLNKFLLPLLLDIIYLYDFDLSRA